MKVEHLEDGNINIVTDSPEDNKRLFKGALMFCLDCECVFFFLEESFFNKGLRDQVSINHDECPRFRAHGCPICDPKLSKTPKEDYEVIFNSLN